MPLGLSTRNALNSRHISAEYSDHAKKVLLQTGPLVPRQDKPKDSNAAKVARAIKMLGKRYVCHRSQFVKKLAEPLPENYVLAGRKNGR